MANSRARNRRKTIAAFPKHGNDYTAALYAHAETLGLQVEQGVFSLRWILRNARRFDCFHFHWPSFDYYVPRAPLWRQALIFVRYAALIALIRMMRVRIVWTAHNLYPHEGGRSHVFHRLGRRWIVFFSYAVFAHGSTAERILVQEFPETRPKIRLISHGHWDGYYPNDVDGTTARAALNLANDSYVYLFVGYCREYKNIEMLVDAFATIDDANVVLVVAGKFASASYQQRIQSMMTPLGPRARLVPEFIPSDRLQWYLNASDSVVLPYRDVLTSGAAMLALSFGRPVVAPGKGVLIDVVPDAVGVLYSTDSVDGLRGAMDRIRERSFDSESIRRFARRFDWDDAARALSDVVAS